ncbi:hypothetical protein EMIT0P218_20367 [Pseudomonas sp. IT-P218]
MTVLGFCRVLSRQQSEDTYDQIQDAPSGISAPSEYDKGVLSGHWIIPRRYTGSDLSLREGFDKPTRFDDVDPTPRQQAGSHSVIFSVRKSCSHHRSLWELACWG